MKFEFKTAIYPSGYEFDKESDVFRPKKLEKFYEKSIDLNAFIQDVYQRFRYQYRDRDARPMFFGSNNNYLISNQSITFDSSSGSVDREVEYFDDSIRKIETLLSDYGLNDGAQLLYEHKKEKIVEGVEKSRYEIIFDNSLTLDESGQKRRLSSQGDYPDIWEKIINKIMDRYNDPGREEVIEIDKLKLLIVKDEITFYPLDLLSAIDCFTFKKGLSSCKYCESPFVKKRSNQIFCSRSCKSSATRKKRELDKKN